MPQELGYLRSPTCWALFFVCLFATALLTPVAMGLARRVGAVDRGGHRRVYEGSMPLLGGLGLAVPFIAVCLLGYSGVVGILTLVESLKPQFMVLALGSVGIVVLGVVDDTRGVRARYKLLAQIGIALFVVLLGETLTVLRLPFFGTLELAPWMGALVGVVWIVGLINAINIIDGIDGLAAGISLIAVVGLLALAAMEQYTFVVFLCIGLAGSLLGFLPYNFNPARVFLGDTGSMFLGFALASITLMATYKSETAVIVLAPLLALGFPIFETLLSMTRRLVRGAPVFSADDGHTHHRLLGQGYSQRRVVMLLYGVSAILTSVAIMSRIAPEGSAWEWISLAVVIVTLIGIAWLAGYLRVARVNTLVRRRERNARMQAFARYAGLSLRANPEKTNAEQILGLACSELGLDSLSLRRNGEVLRIGGSEGLSSASKPWKNLRLPTAGGGELLLEYVPAEDSDEEHRRDVAACLARLFEEAELP